MINKLLAISLGIAVSYHFIFKEDEFNPKQINGKRVLVTGASSGIGEQLVYEYCKHGASVVLTARRENLLKQVASKCRKISPKSEAKVSYVLADMSKPEDLKYLIKETVTYLGGIDYLILNHAYMNKVKEFTGSEEDLNQSEMMWQINVRSYIYLTAYSMPYLRKSSDAKIGVTGSLSGVLAYPLISAYTMNKFALNGFYASLNEEAKLFNQSLTVSYAVVGFVDTELSVNSMKEIGQEPPFGYGDPKQCAETLVRGFTLGQKYVYFIHAPWWARNIFRLYYFFPDIVLSFGL